MSKIIIPTPLRKFTDQNRSFETTKNNLSDAINHFVAEYPQIKENLLDDDGNLRSYIKIYIGDTEVTLSADEPVTLDENTEVSIVPAIAGGIAN